MKMKLRKISLVVVLVCGITLPVVNVLLGQTDYTTTLDQEQKRTDERGAELSALVKAYHEAQASGSSDQMQAIKEKIRQVTRQEFSEMEAKRQADAEALANRLNNLKTMLKLRADRAEEIIDLRVDRLLGNPSPLDWSVDGKSDIEPSKEILRRGAVKDKDAKLGKLESIQKSIADAKGNYGTVGVGMAGIYENQAAAFNKFKAANDRMLQLQAKTDLLKKLSEDFKGTETEASHYSEMTKVLQGELADAQAAVAKLAEANQRALDQVRSGEASMREYEKRIMELEAQLKNVR